MATGEMATGESGNYQKVATGESSNWLKWQKLVKVETGKSINW